MCNAIPRNAGFCGSGVVFHGKSCAFAFGLLRKPGGVVAAPVAMTP